MLTAGLETDFSAYTALGGKDPWPDPSKHRGLGEQATSTTTGNFQLPWQMSSQASPPNLLQGSTTRSSYASAAENCFSGISDSTTALSLLSNEPWGSRSQALDLGVNSFIGVDPGARYSASWDFKGDHYLHEMPPDMGSVQISHSHPTNTPYSMDLGLARPSDGRRHELEPSSGYDSSTHHINWSL